MRTSLCFKVKQSDKMITSAGRGFEGRGFAISDCLVYLIQFETSPAIAQYVWPSSPRRRKFAGMYYFCAGMVKQETTNKYSCMNIFLNENL